MVVPCVGIDVLYGMPYEDIIMFIFVDDSGRPLEFTMRKCSQRKNLRQRIQLYGGALVEREGDHSLTLGLPNNNICNVDVFSMEYIDACISGNELLNPIPFRINEKSCFETYSPFDVIMGYTKWSSIKKLSKNESESSHTEDNLQNNDQLSPKNSNFSDVECQRIIRYIQTEKLQNKVRGTTMWKEMKNKNICKGRTWNSLKEQYLKFLEGVASEVSPVIQHNTVENIITELNDSDGDRVIQNITNSNPSIPKSTPMHPTLIQSKPSSLSVTLPPPSQSVPPCTLSPSLLQPHYTQPSSAPIELTYNSHPLYMQNIRPQVNPDVTSSQGFTNEDIEISLPSGTVHKEVELPQVCRPIILQESNVLQDRHNIEFINDITETNEDSINDRATSNAEGVTTLDFLYKNATSNELSDGTAIWKLLDTVKRNSAESENGPDTSSRNGSEIHLSNVVSSGPEHLSRKRHCNMEQYCPRKKYAKYQRVTSDVRNGSISSNMSENTATREIQHRRKSSERKRPEASFRQLYSTADDLCILEWIIKSDRHQETGGVALWKDLEVSNVLPGRTWQSIKERFRKSILPRLHTYHISKKEMEKFHGSRKTTSPTKKYVNHLNVVVTKTVKRIQPLQISMGTATKLQKQPVIQSELLESNVHNPVTNSSTIVRHHNLSPSRDSMHSVHQLPETLVSKPVTQDQSPLIHSSTPHVQNRVRHIQLPPNCETNLNPRPEKIRPISQFSQIPEIQSPVTESDLPAILQEMSAISPIGPVQVLSEPRRPHNLRNQQVTIMPDTQESLLTTQDSLDVLLDKYG